MSLSDPLHGSTSTFSCRMTDERTDLLEQIAAYAGAINRHEQRGRHGAFQSERKYPYARQSRADRLCSTRNRTLVLSKDNNQKTHDGVAARPQWISSRDRGHMTLTSAKAYDQATASKLSKINDSREAKKRARLLRRDAKEAERLKTLASTTLTHEGIAYRFNRKANLLVRVNLDDVARYPTPSQTFIHGVEFLKSPKSDNLFRKTTIKLNKENKAAKKDTVRYCKYYTRTGLCLTYCCRSLQSADLPGVCTKAKSCPYKHVAQHLAICPHFLSPHGCDESRVCNLSHDPIPQNTPTCTHFLKGACTKDACKYAHVSVSPTAPVCPKFARNGYCGAGSLCGMRHARECPQFSNTGACTLKNCKLPHIARAKASTTQTLPDRRFEPDMHETSDSESEYCTDEYESEDFDENAFGEFVKL